MSLRGQVALVTGSTSGIGFGIAKALAREGAHIALNGFAGSEEVRELETMLKAEYGVRARHFPADVSQAGEVRDLIQSTEDEFGALDILVNNAGVQHVSAIEGFPDEKWEQILATNLGSNFYAIKAALPQMKARGRGRIINIASVHGLVASPFKSAYVAAKHGVIGLTKTVALELVDTEITCNAICPGYVNTPLVESQIDQQALAHGIGREQVIRETILASQPKKSFIEVGHVAALVVFLCSPEAGGITGAALPIDGAWTAR